MDTGSTERRCINDVYFYAHKRIPWFKMEGIFNTANLSIYGLNND